MKADFIPEPELEFGTNTHVDVRFGIATFGPLDVGTATAPKEIRVGWWALRKRSKEFADGWQNAALA